MKKLQSLIILSAICLSVSCKNELKPQDSSEVAATEQSEISTSEAQSTIASSESQTLNSSTISPTASGLNPAHGEPGHRCDIAVGAPLNSPISKDQSQQPVQQQSQKPVEVTTSTPQKVAKGMNPSHGQPGHRCDIAVGAPLNSPAKVAPTPITAPIVNTSETPSLLTPKPTQAVAAGTNPPHGQGGHRCDLAVGAPLPKS